MNQEIDALILIDHIVFLSIFPLQIIQMLREYLNLMGQSEAKERLEHISTQLQHTRTKEQVRPKTEIHIHKKKKKQIYDVIELRCACSLIHRY